MDLKGAEIRNILEMCMGIGSKNQVPLRIVVPYYQRPYRWGEQHITNLMNDFNKNREENPSQEYFVGSVVLVEDQSESNQYDIIDGQQRVTTVFLLNYLRFVIQRSYVEECISIKKPNIDGDLKILSSIYHDLLGSSHVEEIENMRTSIIEKMDTVFTLPEDEREKAFDEIAREYRKAVRLPDRDLTDIEKYLEQYEKLQMTFFNSDLLALQYDRKTFSTSLIEALSKVCIIVSKDIKPEFHPQDTSIIKDANVKQFIDAMIYEFKFLERFWDYTKLPLANVKKMLSVMTEMIDNIKFCVIMTGNERDAYTLFEVLNDRALEIDDLELIKNLFLKAYCTTSGDADAIIDNNIGVLDEIWGDEIFTRDMSVTHTKLVSYLGTIYLTANESAFLKKVERYREIIDSSYLIKYVPRTNPYSFEYARNDIRVFQMAKLILQEYGLPVNNSAVSCIRAENDPAVSISFKTFHLLNALKQHGVLAALSNAVISKYMDDIKKKGKKEVDINDFKHYLKEIKEDNMHSTQSNKYEDIHKLAFTLWQAALLCKDWESPRELAKKGIQNYSKDNYNPSATYLDHSTYLKMKKHFKEWLQQWKYGTNSNNDLKIKVLLINLFKTTKNNDELVIDKAVHTFVTDKLQLDHMEANRPDASIIEKHFTPEDSHEPREQYVDALGNFMILDSENNNNKNNKPLAEALQYYDNMCAGHWLTEECRELLDLNHVNKTIGSEKFPVPTEKFFNERRTRLMFYFERLVLRDLYASKISLKKS